MDSSEECIVCYDNLAVITGGKCGHKVCHTCLDLIKLHNKTCPMCRDVWYEPGIKIHQMYHFDTETGIEQIIELEIPEHVIQHVLLDVNSFDPLVTRRDVINALRLHDGDIVDAIMSIVTLTELAAEPYPIEESNESDVDLIMLQLPSITRETAIKALEDHHGDIVNALMALI